MFERFTDRARRIVVLAQEESRLLGSREIGTEHLLLGIIGEGEGIAALVLREDFGLDLDDVRSCVEERTSTSDDLLSGHIPFTPRSKKALELALREALQLGHNYIGTEHLLLGLIREGEGLGCVVLTEMGADLSSVRQAVVHRLSAYQGATEEVAERKPTTNRDEEMAWASLLAAIYDEYGEITKRIGSALNQYRYRQWRP